MKLLESKVVTVHKIHFDEVETSFLRYNGHLPPWGSDTAELVMTIEDINTMKELMRVEVDGVSLILTQEKRCITVKKVTARDRKRRIDITMGITFTLDDHVGEEAVKIAKTMQRVSAMRTERCTCDYRYGFSDHAEHCLSIYVAKEYSGEDD